MLILSVFCLRWKGTFWAKAHKAGIAGICSHFILWRNQRAWSISWHWAVLPRRKCDPHKEKLFLSSSVYLFSYFSPLRKWKLSGRFPGPYHSILTHISVFGHQVMPNSLWFILGHSLFMPSVFPIIKVFSKESAVCTRWPKYWNFSIIH